MQKIKSMSAKAKLLMGELIGLEVEIIKSIRRELIGIKGLVVDETLNMLVLEKEGKEIKVPKALCVFRFSIENKQIDVDGSEIMFRPEDRIKKLWRKLGGVRRQKVPKARQP